MKVALLISTLILAAFAEWSIAPLLAPYFLPPFFAAAALFWFFRVRFASRIILGIAAGFLMDSISPLPFGTHLATFFLLAFAAEGMIIFISYSESLLIRTVSWAVLVVVFIISNPVIGRGIQTLLN